MTCPGGSDANGCPIPATCMPMTGRELRNSFHMKIFEIVLYVLNKVSKYFNSKKVQLAMMDFSVQPHVQQFARLTTCLAPLDLITMAVRCLKLVYPSMVILIL